LRFGWLRKGFTAAENDSQTFSKPYATVELGVGKNMVNAIRYWCQAYKIIEEAVNSDRPRMPHLVPSAFGHQLLDDDGWDPWLEDPATLWLLHWKLLGPGSQCLAPVWWTAFNLFTPEQFESWSSPRQLDGRASWSPQSRKMSTAFFEHSLFVVRVARLWTTCSTARPVSWALSLRQLAKRGVGDS
jgi:hypothetical protein